MAESDGAPRTPNILPAGAKAPDFARYNGSWANEEAFIGAIREAAMHPSTR